MQRANLDWLCPSCGNTCFASKAACKRCGTSRPGWNPKAPGDWTCPGCKDIQFASRATCRSCNTARPPKPVGAAPPPPVIRSGDWLCKTCNEMQFASRVACRKCSASKPAVEADGDERTCVICMEKLANAALLHGEDMHTCTCLECGNDLLKAGTPCPMCRAPIERVMKIYI